MDQCDRMKVRSKGMFMSSLEDSKDRACDAQVWGEQERGQG